MPYDAGGNCEDQDNSNCQRNLAPFLADRFFSVNYPVSSRPRIGKHPIDLNRFRNILDRLLPQMLVFQLHFVLDMFVNSSRNAYAATVSQAFQASGDIHPIPVNAVLLSLYLQYIKGLSPQGAGVVLIAQPLVMAVFSPLAGKLSDRIEPRVIASLGMALTTLGLVLLALINDHTTLLYIVISLMILGFGFALFSSPNMNAIMSSVAKRYYGIASGSVGTMRVLGQMLSMGIATLVFALFIGRAEIVPELYPELIKSVKIALIISSGLCAAGIFIISSGLCAAGIFFSLSRGDLRSGD